MTKETIGKPITLFIPFIIMTETQNFDNNRKKEDGIPSLKL